MGWICLECGAENSLTKKICEVCDTAANKEKIKEAKKEEYNIIKEERYIKIIREAEKIIVASSYWINFFSKLLIIASVFMILYRFIDLYNQKELYIINDSFIYIKLNSVSTFNRSAENIEKYAQYIENNSLYNLKINIFNINNYLQQQRIQMYNNFLYFFNVVNENVIKFWKFFFKG